MVDNVWNEGKLLMLYVSSGWQLSAPLAVCSQLQLVSCVFRHGAVYFRATCISL
jgi:hypothetical protein